VTYLPPRIQAWYGAPYVDPSWYEETAPSPTPEEQQLQRAQQLASWQSRDPYQRGLVAGRFLPPHRGHQYLIGFARAQVKELTIAIRRDEADSPPFELRQRWLQWMFPDCQVIEGPPFPEVEAVFSSERDHQELATQLGAQLVVVDPERKRVPISGTQIRRYPLKHWDYLPECVRPYYLKVVRVLGSEGSGKTTLVEGLARQLGTCFVPEFCAEVACAQGGRLYPENLSECASRHLACRESLSAQAQRVLLLDTDLMTVQYWGERLFGQAPKWIAREQPVYHDSWLLHPRLEGLNQTQIRERLDFHQKLQSQELYSFESASPEKLQEVAMQRLRQHFEF
jgi:HTH-type transcriptional repressor of NAD biosynthesis genes